MLPSHDYSNTDASYTIKAVAISLKLQGLK